MIRAATVQDIAVITQMVAAYQRDVRPDLQMHTGTIAARVRAMIVQPQGCALLACQGAPCGVLLAQLGPSLWWPETVADLALWWVTPEHRGTRMAAQLMDGFEEWATRAGVGRIGARYAGKSAQRFLERRGYRYADTSMMKDLI